MRDDPASQRDLPYRGRLAVIKKGTTEAALPHIGHLTDGYNFLHKTEGADINRLQPPDKFARSRTVSGFEWETHTWATSTKASRPKSRVCGATRGHWRVISRRR